MLSKQLDQIQPNLLSDLLKQVGRARAHLYLAPPGGPGKCVDLRWHAIDCLILV